VRLSLEHFVGKCTRNDGRHVRSIGARSKKQLKTVELAKTDIGNEKGRLLSDPKRLTGFEGRGFQRLTPPSPKCVSQFIHTFEIAIDNQDLDGFV
jgi:hypothetical protein